AVRLVPRKVHLGSISLSQIDCIIALTSPPSGGGVSLHVSREKEGKIALRSMPLGTIRKSEHPPLNRRRRRAADAAGRGAGSPLRDHPRRDGARELRCL